MDMISIDDLKPGKLLVEADTFFRRRRVFQIISSLQERETCFKVDIISKDNYPNNPKYRNFWRRNVYFTKKELLKNNYYLPLLKKPRINEIFDWYILQFENEMSAQEQNP